MYVCVCVCVCERERERGADVRLNLNEKKSYRLKDFEREIWRVSG